MSLSQPQVLHRTDLTNDRKRLRARAERYRRLRDEYHVLWAEVELELEATEAALRGLERMRSADA